MSSFVARRRVVVRGRVGLSAGLAVAVVLGVCGAASPARAGESEVPGGLVPGTETPALVEGLADAVDASVPADVAARRHLGGHRDRYRIASPDGDLVAEAVTSEADGSETVRLGQKYRGLPVLGAQYVVRMSHRGGKRTVTGTSGAYFTGLDVDTERSMLPPEVAVDRAVAYVRVGLERGRRSGSAAPAISGTPTATGMSDARAAAKSSGPSGEPALSGSDRGLVVLPVGKGVLTRHVTVRGADAVTGVPVVQEVYVDAATGIARFEAGGLRTFGAPSRTTAAQAQDKPAEPGEHHVTGEAVGPGQPDTRVVGSGVLLNGSEVPLNLTKEDASGRYVLRDTAHMADSEHHNAIQTWDASTLWYMDLDGSWPEGLLPLSSPSLKVPAELTESGAVDAHWAAGKVYEYYRDVHHRDSLDDRGMAINSLVGVTAELGYPWVNAFWDGTKMVYGTGDAEYRSLASDLDVVGHEMTHGVVEHTADLVYTGQSGAVNEAIADYFGNAIDVTVSRVPMSDPEAGLIGGDLCRTLTPRECALRDLNDGAATKDFVSMPLGALSDQGGVHINSPIFGGALWDIRESLGGALADRIVYRALSSYLTPLDGFTQSREAVIAAAGSLGVKKAQLNAIKGAFAAHGIVPGWENNLGLDSDILLGHLGTEPTNIANDIAPSARGGWWAVTRSSADGYDPYAVWVGRTDGKGKARKVSPDDGRYHFSPVTDGKRVVWLAVGETLDIMSAPLDGGTPKKLYSTTRGIGRLGMDGDTVAWSEARDGWQSRVFYLKGADTTPHQVQLDRAETTAPGADVWAESPSVKDGRIAFSLRGWWGGDAYQRAAVDVFDTRTGRTALGTPTRSVWTSGPTATASGVYWLIDEDAYDEGQMALRRTRLDGSGETEIIPESSRELIGAASVTASEKAITLTLDPPWSGQPSKPYLDTKLYQYTLEGIPLGRVSCAPGRQTGAAADTGKRVVWLDTTTTAFELVTRSRPAGSCA